MTSVVKIRIGAQKRTRKRRFLAAEDGSSLIELGLLLPVAITIILAATECAVYQRGAIVVLEAASVGARYGIVAGNASDVAGMKKAAQNASQGLTGFTASATAFCSCSPGGSQVSCSVTCSNPQVAMSHYVQVTTSATLPGAFHVAGLPTSMKPTATSTMRASWPGN